MNESNALVLVQSQLIPRPEGEVHVFARRKARLLSVFHCRIHRPSRWKSVDSDTHRMYHFCMTKKLIKHGNSAALVLDKPLLDLLNVSFDTPLEVTTDGQNIIISPQSGESGGADVMEALEKINRSHGSVLKKLGE